uniref:Premelanosome protein b n=1 Tax=Labrus bergylta TaxID=56723 RepID=A0A3Q3GIZ3_9LABR
WNNKMYPVWKEGDARYKEAWKGGRVTFNVGNDSPTLTGAKVTFTIELEFPKNQKVMPDGDVVWAEDCHHESEPVYPAPNVDWEAVFPDGTPIKKDKKPAYVFVWKTWGQYWQVADGPSSSLTISTDDIPLGSYVVDIVIYHFRSKEKFIPLGYASTQFSITDQIPFAVSLDQVNDIVAGDMRFVQNRAIAFTISLHDPSGYLSNADITFNWDFGDESGALISRELTVTHTYVSTGHFKPQVVIQAMIPDRACDPIESPTKAPAPPADQGTTVLPADSEAQTGLVADKPSDDDCVIYRYGSFCTGIEVCEGIEKVEIVQMSNALMVAPHLDKNVLDITVTCQGSLPKEVCSVILDAQCLKPIHTVCNMVEPSGDCQLVLRHFFNDSGVYCINVSMANDVSLAATSAKVNVDMGMQQKPPNIQESCVVCLGLTVWCIFSVVPVSDLCSGASVFWNLLNRRGAVDNCPLLQERPV